MKLVRWVVFSLLAPAMLWGQSAPAPSAAPAPNAAPVSPASPAAGQPRFPGQPMTPTELNSQHLAQMQRLMDELKAMQIKLDEMKANAAKVKDPTLKQQLQLDNELWAMMLSHVQAITVSTAQRSNAYGRFGPGEQLYRQQRQALRQSQPPPGSPAVPAAPAAPPDHP